MKIPIQPTKDQKKENKAKYKAAAEKSAQQQASRQQYFSNDEGAKNAVRQMTTKQGYDPNPLAPRGGQQSEPPIRTRKFKARPKYRDL